MVIETLLVQLKTDYKYMQEKKIEAKELIEQIIEGIQDKKGKGIVVVDML